MSESRVVGTFVLTIAIVAIVSGPVVGAVGLRGPQGPPAGTGSATVAVESVPTGEFVLERGAFGAGRYHVTAPPTVVTVSDVEGNPVLRYSIDVPALFFAVSSRYELAETGPGQIRLWPMPAEISPAHVDQGSYKATVAIWLRTGDRFRQIDQRQISLEVRR